MPKPRKRPIKKMKVDAAAVFSYKQPEFLRKFVSEQGYIVSRTISGLSMKRQRALSQAIKRARHLGLLPFTQTLG